MTTTYFGVDCAKWQGTIDWAKVKAAGVKFAILKATRKDNTAEDVFAENYSGCVENGISVGVYRYVYAKTAQEAENEAHGVLAVIKGRNISCGVWLDLEDNTLISLGKTKLLSIINAERKILEEAGYPVGIYCNQAWYNGTLPVDSIDLPFWLARYGTNNGTQQVRPEVKCSHTLWGWQYSSVGRVSGIPGAVDVNVAYQIPGNVSGGTSTLLRKEDQGERVRLLQRRLILCGWKLITDGIWGERTDAAVRDYQCKAGLAVDGVVGPKTNGKLIQDAIVSRAQTMAAYMIQYKWHYKGNGYTVKSTFAATAKLDKPGSSCAHYVSWVLQDVGLLQSGRVLSHSAAGMGTGAKAIVNANQLLGCNVSYPNANLADYSGQLWPGDVLVHDSSIGIYVLDNGKPTVLTAREGQPINDNRQYVDLSVTSGYEWKHDILAVVRAG